MRDRKQGDGPDSVAAPGSVSSQPEPPSRGPEQPVSEIGGDATRDEPVEGIEGMRVIEGWDDLLDLEPGQRVLVPLPSPTADAVWEWHQNLTRQSTAGDLARAIRDILTGMHDGDLQGILSGSVSFLHALSGLVEAVKSPAPAARTEKGA